MHFVYIVECADGTLYTGYTTDIERRLEEHNNERKGGAKYTAGRSPVELRFKECFDTRALAQKREHQIKSLSREQKKALINGEIGL